METNLDEHPFGGYENRPTRAFRSNLPALDLFPTTLWTKITLRWLDTNFRTRFSWLSTIGWANASCGIPSFSSTNPILLAFRRRPYIYASYQSPTYLKRGSRDISAKGLDLVLSVPCLLVNRESHAASWATVVLEQSQGRIGETNLPELVEGAYRAIGHLVANPLW